MKLYAKQNMTDPEKYELFYWFNKAKYILALVLYDDFDLQIQEALAQNEDEAFDLELELKLR